MNQSKIHSFPKHYNYGVFLTGGLWFFCLVGAFLFVCFVFVVVSLDSEVSITQDYKTNFILLRHLKN